MDIHLHYYHCMLTATNRFYIFQFLIYSFFQAMNYSLQWAPLAFGYLFKRHV